VRIEARRREVRRSDLRLRSSTPIWFLSMLADDGVLEVKAASNAYGVAAADLEH
jgi:hypothetical protein